MIYSTPYSLLFFCFFWTCDSFEPKDCILSKWGSWSSCSSNCSIGRTTRFRHIKQAPVGIFSKDCHPVRNQSRKCGSANNGCQMLCEPKTGQCHCKSGYNLGTDLKSCSNINECLHNNGLGACTQKCIDTIGNYQCDCNSGFHLAPDGHDCIYNIAVNCSKDLHLFRKVPSDQCVCKNALHGMNCDRNLMLCSNKNQYQCFHNNLCMTFIHAYNKCLPKEFQVSILLDMKYRIYHSGNTVYEVEKYIEDVLEKIDNGKSLTNLKGNGDLIGSDPKLRKYYVESVYSARVKSSFTLAKFGVLDVQNNFQSLRMNQICSLLKSDDIQCVTAEDCNLLKEHGIECPIITSYGVAEIRSQYRRNETKPWVYILISGFAIIIVLLILLLFLYMKQKKQPPNISTLYNNNPSQSIFFRPEYDPLTQRESVANWRARSIESPEIYSQDRTFEAGNFELYNTSSSNDDLHKGDPIYESITSLNKVISSGQSAFPTVERDNPRYIKSVRPCCLSEECSCKNMKSVLCDNGEISSQIVDIPEESGMHCSPHGNCSKDDKDIVNLPEEEEPRYTEPPGRR